MQLAVPPGYGDMKMIAIDPGSNTCGMAIYDLDTFNKKIKSITAFTIEVDKLNDGTGLHLDITTDRMIKILKLCGCIKDIIETTGAKIVVSEAPFYNRFMPMAYGALLEVVSAINRSVYEVSNDIVFTSYAPQQVKMSIGAAGKKGKDIIKEKLKETSAVYDKISCDYELLDEHSIDAIAVGFTFLEQRSGKNVWS